MKKKLSLFILLSLLLFSLSSCNLNSPNNQEPEQPNNNEEIRKEVSVLIEKGSFNK